MKYIFSILKIFIYGFIILGILGIIVGITSFDISILVFYVFWFLIGIILLFFIQKYKRRFLESKTEEIINKPSKEDGNDIHQEKLSSVSSDYTAESKPKPLLFPDTYIVLDVETPNRHNNSISQIGLYLIENGNIVKNCCTLINPEDKFDQININLTGVDPSMISNAPKLNEYWPSISDLFQKYVVVSHNAVFDLTVMYKALNKYGIYFPDVKYLCTFVESNNKLPSLSKHSLSALAEYYNIQVEKEHDAGYDAVVCYRVFEEMKKNKYFFTPSDFHSIESTLNNTVASSDTTISDSESNEIINLPFSDDVNIQVSGNKFVLTGVFTLISKSDIIGFIEDNGGYVTSAVSGKTNYLIVGSDPEPAWKFGKYGRKIEKALELKSTGKSAPKFITEKLFVNNVYL